MCFICIKCHLKGPEQNDYRGRVEQIEYLQFYFNLWTFGPFCDTFPDFITIMGKWSTRRYVLKFNDFQKRSYTWPISGKSLSWQYLFFSQWSAGEWLSFLESRSPNWWLCRLGIERFSSSVSDSEQEWYFYFDDFDEYESWIRFYVLVSTLDMATFRADSWRLPIGRYFALRLRTALQGFHPIALRL